MIYLMGPIEPEIAIGVGTVGLGAATAIIKVLWSDNQRTESRLEAVTREVLENQHETANVLKDILAALKRLSAN